MQQYYKFFIDKSLHNHRLDKTIYTLINTISRNKIQSMIHNKQVILNKKPVSKLNHNIKKNDIIKMYYISNTINIHKPKTYKLNIIYQDQDIIIINKTINMLVHHNINCEQNTLINALKYNNIPLSNLNQHRPGIVHRLDKDTSGLIIIAKHNQSYLHIKNQITNKQIIRKYKALVWGKVKQNTGIIQKYMIRKPNSLNMICQKNVTTNTITYYKNIQTFHNISLLECTLDTGKTHQIRTHLSSIGHSLVGDTKYGKNNKKIQKQHNSLKKHLQKIKHQMLHAYYLKLQHPTTNKVIELHTNLPKRFTKIIHLLTKTKNTL